LNKDNSAKTYGFNLLRLRKKAGFKSQEKLADLVKVSRGVIKVAEEGRSIPQAVNRAKIAEVLGVDESEFWRDPAEFDPKHEKADKVRAAVKSVLEASGYRVEDLPELFGYPQTAPKTRAKKSSGDDPEVKKDKALIDEYLAKKKKQRSVG
jgi:transcriptional regulator with XRE-family HTH domain